VYSTNAADKLGAAMLTEADLKAAARRFKEMPLDEQHKMIAAQRKSWVIGETMLAHPEMTREQAEQLYYEVVGKE
jgi:hypothetical protein